ncbi:hydrogenase-2 assembly chaperone [Superficieibacter sp. HKU1]|uniref:hydrogenase-2 assembly chaperone n=1 Tax=Superficieibacter sp. HKU1 TaxID=3031919 RepID=UPI0023E20B39|nr:hydrogenase-2 assembly chaperone [Superficieibacter sp. HKU1]WES67689.1 hydrogenase-2 assembly chaperone [Superficieibacter sp. HKU1]
MSGKRIEGYTTDPSALIERVFQQVAESSMVGLPFYRAHLPVKACAFHLFEGQWFGALLTPWMLALLVLPGPGQRWDYRRADERLALTFPQGNIVFRPGEIAPELYYLSCSLMSPVDLALDAEQAIALAENSVRLALSLPVRHESGIDTGRRALLRGTLSTNRS